MSLVCSSWGPLYTQVKTKLHVRGNFESAMPRKRVFPAARIAKPAPLKKKNIASVSSNGRAGEIASNDMPGCTAFRGCKSRRHHPPKAAKLPAPIIHDCACDRRGPRVIGLWPEWPTSARCQLLATGLAFTGPTARQEPAWYCSWLQLLCSGFVPGWGPGARCDGEWLTFGHAQKKCCAL